MAVERMMNGLAAVPAAALLLAVSVAAPATGNAPAAEPAGVVERLHAVLLQSMQQADDLGFQGRFRLVEPIVDGAFDFPTIARVVVGRHWKELDDEQRRRFLELFAELSKATYAARFDGFDGEQFRTVAVEPGRDGYRMVRTELDRGRGEPVQLAYLVRNTADGWQIVNVIADGVSDLSLKRADYAAVIREQGFDALLTRLQEQIAQYAGTPAH